MVQEQVQQSPLDLQRTSLHPAQVAPQLMSRSSFSGPSRRSRGSFERQDFTVPARFDNDEPLEVAQTSAQAQPEPEVGAEGPLSLTTRVEYSALPRGQTRDVFGLVSVQAAMASAQGSPSEQEERQAMDLICVLDVSGSMTGAKIQQVKEAMRFVISQADPRDRLSVVPFNSSAGLSLPLSRMTAQGKDAANVATVRLTAGGGTSIASGLSVALSVMEQRRQRNKVAAILLLTDGQDGRTRAQLPSLLERASSVGCALYAFGFGADHDAALLGDIAERARTPFTFVEDTSNVAEAFAGAVGGLSSVVAQGVELTLECGMELKAVHTPFAVQREEAGGLTRAVVTIPDVFAGERRDVLVEVAVPAQSEDAVLLRASLRYTDLRRGVPLQSPVAEMAAVRVDEPQPEMEPDEVVSDQRRRVEVTEALRDATSKGDRGDFQEAQRVLSAAEQRLSAGSRQSALKEALGQELADAKSRMCSRSAWEHGGRAEVQDAWQMHSVQRCAMKSSAKSSKAMYISRTQDAWCTRSKGH